MADRSEFSAFGAKNSSFFQKFGNRKEKENRNFETSLIYTPKN